MKPVQPSRSESKSPDRPTFWDFPGWGTAEHIEKLSDKPITVRPLDSAPAHRLGVWKATAICGNDITSSCLYVAALCAIYAGPYAPLALALVALRAVSVQEDLCGGRVRPAAERRGL